MPKYLTSSNRLYHLTEPSILALDTESDHGWCATKSRDCYPCQVDTTEPYKFCADRVMNTAAAKKLLTFNQILQEAGEWVKTGSWRK